MKIEFFRRLVRLGRAINQTVYSGKIHPDFYPSLFSMISYLYMKSPLDVVRKNNKNEISNSNFQGPRVQI